jgi:hypothetical protein
MSPPDREVALKTHELVGRYGAFKAAIHAERIAQQALADGGVEHDFWSAVAQILKRHSPT